MAERTNLWSYIAIENNEEKEIQFGGLNNMPKLPDDRPKHQSPRAPATNAFSYHLSGSSCPTSTKEKHPMIHSAAAVAALSPDEDGDERFLRSYPASQPYAARGKLLPYTLPPSFRVELLADVAADCRRNFGNTPGPIGAVREALKAVCPDATGAELRAVLVAAEDELLAKLDRLGGWHHNDQIGITDELEMWFELAMGRIGILRDCMLNTDRPR